MSIEVSNESGTEVVEADLVSVARYALGRMDVHPAAELSVVLVDSSTMADLHVQWMDLPGPTDVMAFPMDELRPGGRPDAADLGPAVLGDIVLCPPFAAEQAATAGHSLDDELHLLTVHGVLHLLGYDHAEPEDEKAMFGLQNSLLADWQAQQRRAAHQAVLDDVDSRVLGVVGLDERPDR
ncbi:rRNA maturation RNase YbeY [Rhodococcus antarcticus]|uniref:Endoribonuclease YbeY n=1 Tax=Rhodococcus antarcticus TaxID=2987751 RepID=A0ABY6NWJ4_9NOCA|nr:rRNA maturation RNase YbeY [Rhodococcus antarcticus]UZJ23769.1 rRNA maturation RNase YbeY [Rhodococcus antarcticus]